MSFKKFSTDQTKPSDQKADDAPKAAPTQAQPTNVPEKKSAE
ncbi:MAG: hypothetical protein O3B37_13395 [Proteobacteria bacterium]|nr:hypothetical protein [Pseudomonadota bacterium]